jgi:hypothetical protein
LTTTVDEFDSHGMRNYFITLVLFGALTGCASFNQAIEISRTGTSKTISGPDGTPHELVQCTDIEICYKKSTEVCKGNFKIVDHTTSYRGSDTASVTSLLVKCGG